MHPIDHPVRMRAARSSSQGLLFLIASAICLTIVLSPGWTGRDLGFTLPVAVLAMIAGLGALWLATRLPSTRAPAAFAVVIWATAIAPLMIFLVRFLAPTLVPRLVDEVGLLLQYVFFGRTLVYHLPNHGYVISQPWQGIVTVGFWAAVCTVFSRLVRDVRSVPILIILAATTLLLVVGAMVAAASIIGCQFVPETP